MIEVDLLQVANSTKKHGRAYFHNFGSTQKNNNPDCINSPEDLDEELDDGYR